MAGLASIHSQRRFFPITTDSKANSSIAPAATANPRVPVLKNEVSKFIPSMPASTARKPITTVAQVSMRMPSLVTSAVLVGDWIHNSRHQPWVWYR